MTTLRLILSFCLILALNTAKSQTISSTSAGGDWFDTLTWVGHTVPIWSSNVVINGPVTVQTGYYSECMNLTVSAGASLVGGSIYGDEFKVYGSLSNFGTISSSSSADLRMRLRGNFTNQGIIDLKRLVFDTGSDKYLSSSTILNIDEITMSDTCDVILASAITLENSQLNLSYYQHGLHLNGYDLTLTAGYFSGKLYGESGRLILTNTSKLYGATIFGEIDLLGITQLHATNYFYGDIHVLGTLKNFNDGYSGENYFYGNLLNDGVIEQHSGFNWIAYMYGNYSGNGSISIFRLSFNGSKKHNFSSPMPITSSSMVMGANDTLMLQSNVEVVNCSMSFLTNNLLDIQGNTLKLTSSTLTGVAHAGSGTLWLTNNSKIQSLSVYEQVYLKGNVQVGDGTVHFYGNTELLDTLQSVGYYSQESHFHASLYNTGEIKDGSSSLFVYLYDSLVNEGSCTPYAMYFIGSVTQTVQTVELIAPDVLNLQNPNGLTVLSDLKLKNTTVNANNNPLYLNNFSLIGDTVTLNSIKVYSDSGSINLNDGGYVYNCKFYGPVDVLGTFLVYADYTTFYDEIRNYGIIRNYPGYYSYNITFNSDLINEGTVTGSGLTVTCNGNLANHAVFNANQLFFSGSGVQSISTSAAIQSNYVSCVDTSGYLLAVSDLFFNQADISLNNEQIFLDGNRLNVSDGYLITGEIWGGDGSLKMNANAYISNLDFFTPITLEGTIQIYGDQNNFYGLTTVLDTLSRYPSYYGFSIYNYSTLVNEGLITDYLYINAYQDIVNHGTWNNYQLTMAGSGNQMILASQPISCAYLNSSDTSGSITAASNLHFIGTELSLSYEQINLAGFELQLDDGLITNSIVYGNNGAVNFVDNSYMTNLQFYTPVKLKGNARIYGDAVDFFGDVLIEDTLSRLPSYYSFAVDFYGDVDNSGFVTGNGLIVQLFGDLLNQGTWNNAQTNLLGETDQYLTLVNNSVMATQLRWYANVINASTFEWYKNGVSLAGETANLFANEQGSFLYNNDTIDQLYTGQYQCSTNQGNSRNIFINHETIIFDIDLGADIAACEGEQHTVSPLLFNGIPPYTYLWSNGLTTSSLLLSGTSSGTYALTVTDANQSVAMDTIHFTVMLPPAVNLPSDTVACDGLMLMVPVFDAGFQWSTGSSMNHILIFQSGIYSLTVTANNSCSIEDEIAVSIVQSPMADLGPDTTLQAGASYTLHAGTGGSTYLWSTGETTASILVSTTGIYAVTITNGFICSDIDEVTVTFLPPLSNLEVLLQDTVMVCEGSSAELLPQPVNGIPPYSYLWSTGNTASSLIISPLQSGVYSLTLTDGTGATALAQTVVIVNQVNDVVITGISSSCEGQIEMLSASGTGSYLWSTGHTSSQLFVSETGIYTITLTDIHGCTSTDSHSIEFVANPVFELGNTIESCLGDVVVIQPGLTGNYYWSNGSTSNYLTVTLSGNYSLTVINPQGCSGSDEVEVLFHSVPVVNLGPDLNLAAGSSINLNAGAGFVEYFWSNGASTAAIETNLPGSYSVEVLDSNGCWGYDEMMFTTYTINPNPGWTTVNTGVMHTILLPDTCEITIDGVQLSPGDYIGVFYTSGSNLVCGGYTMYSGQVNALTVWGDDEMTTDKDGFASGEMFTFKLWQAATGEIWDADVVYMPVSMMPNQGLFVVNGLSGIISLTASSVDYQYINLPANWSYFSTYIDLFQPNIADLFSPLVSSLIIAKNGAGNVYWPQYGLNLIGNCMIGYGYQVKLMAPQTLVCEGIAVDPALTPFTIPVNWSIIGYLRDSQASIVTLLAPIVNNVIIVKNSAGQTYWPQWNLNTIGNMKPGEGYLIKMLSPVQFTYPANNQNLKLAACGNSRPVHFLNELNAETNMTVCIPFSAWPIQVSPGDEIAAFNEKNQLAGSSKVSDGATGLTIWQFDDAFGKGMLEGEPVHFVLWSAERDEELSIEIQYKEGSNFYEINGLAVADRIIISGDTKSALSGIVYPNPASEEVTLQLYNIDSGQLRICIFDTRGELIRLLEPETPPGNLSLNLNVHALPAGLYFLQATNNLQTLILPLNLTH